MISDWFERTNLSPNLQNTSSSFKYIAFFDSLSETSSAVLLSVRKNLVTLSVKNFLLSLKIS